MTFEDDEVVFYATGSAKGASGSVTITDRQGASRSITIIASTGKITVE